MFFINIYYNFYWVVMYVVFICKKFFLYIKFNNKIILLINVYILKVNYYVLDDFNKFCLFF